MVRFGGPRRDNYDAGEKSPLEIMRYKVGLILTHISLYRELASIMNDTSFLIANSRMDDIGSGGRYKVKEMLESAKRLAEELKIPTTYMGQNTERAVRAYKELLKMTPSQVAGHWETTATPLMNTVYRAGYDDARYLVGKILGY